MYFRQTELGIVIKMLWVSSVRFKLTISTSWFKEWLPARVCASVSHNRITVQKTNERVCWTIYLYSCIIYFELSELFYPCYSITIHNNFQTWLLDLQQKRKITICQLVPFIKKRYTHTYIYIYVYIYVYIYIWWHMSHHITYYGITKHKLLLQTL